MRLLEREARASPYSAWMPTTYRRSKTHADCWTVSGGGSSDEHCAMTCKRDDRAPVNQQRNNYELGRFPEEERNTKKKKGKDTAVHFATTKKKIKIKTT